MNCRKIDSPVKVSPSTHRPTPSGTSNTRRLSDTTNNYHLKCTGSIRGAPCPLEAEDYFTDEAFTEHSYYDFFDHDHGYQTSHTKPQADEEDSWSDESDSTRLPRFEHEELATRRHSRNQQIFIDGPPRKDVRRVYPQDVQSVHRNPSEPSTSIAVQTFPRRNILSRTSDRVASSLSNDGSPVIHGCGGKCQTLENVCYYFLQGAFIMGILIGVSLGIAGWILRKSAARNLQVLLYIGAMLSLVCALLLGIQRSARNASRSRQKPVVRNTTANRNSFEMFETSNFVRQNTLRGVPTTVIHVPGQDPVLKVQRAGAAVREPLVEQPGVPWWRRKDLT